MSPRASDSRRRMVESAAALLREYGASATTLDRVLTHSGAPRGSLYHHFPGGRTQLLEEATALAGDFISGLIDDAARSGDPLRAVDTFFELWRDWLQDSQFRAGCPIVAVAVETNDGAPHLARSAAEIFGRWQEALSDSLIRRGIPEVRGLRLATFIIATVEGAVVMCRAQRSIAPLDAVAEEIHDLLFNALRTTE